MNTPAKTKKYRVVGLGGTFDHFHAGHEHFLQCASALSEHLVVGVSTPALLTQKSFPEQVETYEVRAQAVRDFLHKLKIEHTIVPLDTIEGPAVTSAEIEAIVLTPDTRRGGEYINNLRQAAGKSPLSLEEVSMVAGGSSSAISSSSIRAGTHDRNGYAYAELFSHAIHLTDGQRAGMRQVLGVIVDHPDPTDHTRYLVGDSTLRRFLEQDERYDMGILDGKEQRVTYHPLVIDQTAIDLVVVNPPGQITPMLARGTLLALRQHLIYIFVDGEEDLAAVVLLMLLPLGSSIYYGQPNVGLVRWEVTEDAKAQMAKLLNPHFQTNPKLVE